MNRELLSSLSPIFNLKDVKIIWAGDVFKVGHANTLRPRFLVISSSGIFLFRNGSFSFQSKLVNSISFFDLVSIYTTDQYASFSSTQTQIRVKLSDMKELSSLVFFIRQTQFPTDVLPINFSFANKQIANTLTLKESPYQPSNVFIDRTLSCMMHFNIHTDNETLEKIQKPLMRSFKITNEMLKLPIFPAILLSFSYEQDVEILKLEKIKLVDLLSQSSVLFSYNRFIKIIEFINVDFQDSHSSLAQLFSNAHNFKPTKWIFSECDLTEIHFKKFMDEVSNIGRDITDLHFSKCKFSDQTFSALFQTIYFNECFHSLNSLSFDFIEANHILSHLSETLCCSWLLEKKCLHSISVQQANEVDMSPLLSQILNFELGVTSINFSNNVFKSPLFINNDKKSYELSFIGFKNCKLSNDFINSFISNITKRKIKFRTIDLSCISSNMENSDFTNFLNFLSQLSMPALQSFSFNKNKMNSSQASIFVNFLKQQENLKALSINCSFDIHDSPKGLLSFIEFFNSRSFDYFSIKGNKFASLEFSYGRMLLNLLQNLKNAHYLNISHQCIGQEGLEILVPYLNSTHLHEIHFDGSNVKSFDFLCKFCTTILSSSVKFASFPEIDFQNLLKATSKFNYDDYETSVNDLRDAFLSKYGDLKHNILLENLTSLSQTNKTKEEKENTIQSNTKSHILNEETIKYVPNSLINSSMNYMQQDIKEIYKECIENEHLSQNMQSLLSKIDQITSFDYLFSSIPQ